jgi:predicted nucleotidyltransferase
VDGLVRGGVFWARAGRARLLPPDELSEGCNPLTDDRVWVWEAVVRVARALDQPGGAEAARLISLAMQRADLDAAKELAYLLHSVCEQKGRTDATLLFNGLVRHDARGAVTLDDVRRHCAELAAIGERYGVENIRVFGSVARGEADESSDLDLLVDVLPGLGLLAMSALAGESGDPLRVFTRVATVNGLRPRIRARVLAEAVPR